MSAHVVERLSAYLDGELEAAERLAVQAHLEGCDECSVRLEQFAAVDELARALPLEAPAGYFEALPARVRFKVMPRRRQGPKLPAWSWAVAAALLVAVVTPTLLERNPQPADLARSVAPAPPQALPAAKPDRKEQPAEAQSSQAEEAPVEAERRKGLSYDERAAAKLAASEAAPPPPSAAPAAPAPATARADPAQTRRNESSAPLAKAEEAAGKDKVREESTAEAGRASAAPLASVPFAVPPESALLEGAAGQHLYEPGAEADSTDAPARTSEAKRARDQKSVGALQDAGPSGRPAPKWKLRDLLAEKPGDAEEARLLREKWRAFVAQGPPPSAADEGRVRIVETGLLAWRYSNDPADLTLAERDAEAYLRRDDAAQGDRVRSLLASTGR